MKFLNKIDSAEQLIQDKDNRLVTDVEKAKWDTVTGKETPAGAQTKATKALTDSKAYVDGKVKTDVPANAKFTDTITTINGKTGAISKADIVALGIPAQDTVVDISGKADKTYVDNKVKTDVPLNAKFTDTVYSHPSTHPASMITGLPTSLPANGGGATTSKHLVGDDTRSVNSPPSAYMSGGARWSGRAGWQTEFKYRSTIGNPPLTGTYVYLQTHTPWSDPSGGYPIQLVYGNGHPAWRVGVSTTAWSAWISLNDGGNANTVNGKTVGVNVPANAKFTDTIVDISGKADKTYVDNLIGNINNVLDTINGEVI